MRLSARDQRAVKRGILVLMAIAIGGRTLPATLRWRAESMATEAMLDAEMRRRSSLLEAQPGGTMTMERFSGLLHARSAAEGAGRLGSLLSTHANDMRVQLGSMEPSADSAQSADLALIGVRAAGVADIAGLIGLVERLESDETTIRLRSLRVMPSNPADGEDEAERLRFELEIEALVNLLQDSARARR